ncbi:hypothetical protein JJ691_61040 [Kutzneria sp. CA-103260]|nr:hypothetical protein JJ691_61040 [Kutzneria sp. CA-103260]
MLDDPGPLSPLARDFLARNAKRLPVDLGPDDERLRADMRAAYGRVDEDLLARLRWAQDRYAGLSYQSPLFYQAVFFQPQFDPEDEPAIWGVLQPDPADGCFDAGMAVDGTVLFGMFESYRPAFPSLDHFLECDAVMEYARRGRPCDDDPPPNLRLVEHASGFDVEWSANDEALVHRCGLWAELGFPGLARGMWIRQEPGNALAL